MTTKIQKNIVFSENRKAYHDYQVIDTLEVGIQLFGIEVKAIRSGHMSLNGSYVVVLDGKLQLVASNISVDTHGFLSSYKADRNRILLCHKKELIELKHQSEAKGMTIVPLKVYEKQGKMKLLVGVARGKNTVDKRQSIKNRDIDRGLRQFRS